jgi:hypothetical protein
MKALSGSGGPRLSAAARRSSRVECDRDSTRPVGTVGLDRSGPGRDQGRATSGHLSQRACFHARLRIGSPAGAAVAGAPRASPDMAASRLLATGPAGYESPGRPRE